MAVSSSLESLLPSSSACTSCVVRSSPGFFRRNSNSCWKYICCHQVAGIALLDFGLRQRHRIEQASAVARTGVEHLAMLLGNSEHVADDRDRQPERKILDQVHVALARNAIQRLVDDLLDARTHVLDPARRERLHHQPAQARVVGRILLQHPVAHAAEDRLLHDLRAIAPLRPFDEILAEALVAQNETDLGVAARDKHAEAA